MIKYELLCLLENVGENEKENRVFQAWAVRYKYNTWIIREVWPKLLKYLVIRTNGNDNERQ